MASAAAGGPSRPVLVENEKSPVVFKMVLSIEYFLGIGIMFEILVSRQP